MSKGTLFLFYWILCMPITIFILNKQNKKISLDGVIGNTPNFAMIMGVLGGWIYVPVYFIIKLIKYIVKN
jgi:hypothetical protein